jgi:uncharacterized membrane protein
LRHRRSLDNLAPSGNGAATILATGIAETLAAIITAIAAILRAPMIVTILIGVASVVFLRWVI